MRADKPFDRIGIYHNDPESEEYEEVDAEYKHEGDKYLDYVKNQ